MAPIRTLDPSSTDVKAEWIYAPAPPIHLHDVNRNEFTFLSFTAIYLST